MTVCCSKLRRGILENAGIRMPAEQKANGEVRSMLVINVDRNKKDPLYRQITEEIKHKIENGVLKDGERIPSSRILAEQLGVSRQTVTQAYSELWSQGYLSSNSGSYTRVRSRPKIIFKNDRENCIVNYEELIGHEKNECVEKILNSEYYRNGREKEDCKELIDMSTMDLDSSVFPVGLFKKSLGKVLNEYPAEILNYCEYKGFRPLREWISKRMKTHSVDVDCEEILITNGVSQAAELFVKVFTERGDTVFIESPGYRMAISLFRFYGLEVIEIPMNIHGMDLAILEKEIENAKKAGKRLKLIYTVPSFQNPTGITTSQTHRENLLSICEEYSVPLIEDSFEEEIKYFDKVVLPIKSMDRFQTVFYLGTFSKVLFPGLRLGWIAGNRNCIDKLTAVKGVSDLSGNSLSQAALFEFCDSGYYDAYIRKMNRIYLDKMNYALECVERHIPRKFAQWEKPSGGYLIWFEVSKNGFSEEEFRDLCTAKNLKLAMGSSFFYRHTEKVYVRMCISSVGKEKIGEGIKRLAEVLFEINGRFSHQTNDS